MAAMALVCSLLFLFLFSACAPATSGTASSGSTAGISIVAAENFYGDLFKQLGGNYVSVTSILSDPNADPHQYESNVQNAVAVSNAKIVIENGDGYDSWMDKLLSASPNANRIVLVASTIADHKLPDNPHVWYGIDNVQTIVKAMTAALKRVDASHASAYDSNLASVSQSLASIQQTIAGMRAKYTGTPVGLTEDIYLYQATPLGLNVLTPFAFQKAIAEGNDPPADTVITANNQITHHQIKVLIYNEQTVTPITTNLQNEAKAAHIPIVPVTETMPAGKTYQKWMLDQLASLAQALGDA